MRDTRFLHVQEPLGDLNFNYLRVHFTMIDEDMVSAAKIPETFSLLA